MFNDQRAIILSSSIDDDHQDHDDDEQSIREIHALTPQRPRSSALSMASHESGTSSTENFTTISREFNALVLAGTAAIGTSQNDVVQGNNNNLDRIREEDIHQALLEETNPLAIVPDNNPLPSPRNDLISGGHRHHHDGGGGGGAGGGGGGGEVSIQSVKKEEVESKINAWQTAKIAKINNRFKREDAIINGWESEEVQKATTVMKKVERKLEEKKAKALEKMQNDIAKSRRKAEERRASAEGKRGTKVAKVMEIANLMKAIGKAPSKRSFF